AFLASAFVPPAQARQVLLVEDFADNTIGKYSAVSGAPISAQFVNSGQGLNGPVGMTIDNNNRLVVDNIKGNNLCVYDATTGASLNVPFANGQGLSGPIGLAADNANHLFVPNNGNTNVSELDATTGAIINAAFISPIQMSQGGIVFDNKNHLF